MDGRTAGGRQMRRAAAAKRQTVCGWLLADNGGTSERATEEQSWSGASDGDGDVKTDEPNPRNQIGRAHV